MRCQAILLKGTGRSNEEISSILGCTAASVYIWQKRFEAAGISGLKTKSAQRRKPILTALDEDSVRKAIENDRQSLRVAKANWEAATGRTVSESTLRRFLKTLVRDIKRIRLRPQGSPDPQCYEYKKEKLKELKVLSNEGHIDPFFGDESHVCTQGYVPYGWQFKDEDVFIPARKAARLNLFGFVNRNNEYHGFTAQENITQDKIVSYLDEFSKSITKKTVLVLDNASVHRGRKVTEKREEWAERGLFVFYLPPYSPQLNIAETLCRILKGK